MAISGVSFLGFSSAVLANQTDDSTTSDSSLTLPTYADASDSPDWAVTPDGLMYKSCVHQVPDGAMIDTTTDTVTLDDVVIAKYEPCPYKETIQNHDSAQTLAQKLDNDANALIPLADGWWLSSFYSSPNQITYVSANWTVPPAPVQTGATVFLFPSAEPYAENAIVQPVLQWGVSQAGGGNYWGIADWYVDSSGNAYISSLQKTTSGHQLLGTISRSSGSSSTWNMQISDKTGGISTTLNFNTGMTSWNTAEGGVLEAYNISSCRQLPATTSLAFTNVTVKEGGTVAPYWSSRVDYSTCADSVTATGPTTALHWNTNW
jgi:hypothetical protein